MHLASEKAQRVQNVLAFDIFSFLVRFRCECNGLSGGPISLSGYTFPSVHNSYGVRTRGWHSSGLCGASSFALESTLVFGLRLLEINESRSGLRKKKENSPSCSNKFAQRIL